MWVAQGFIQPQEENNNILLEDIGDKYFNILLSRSLFQDVVKDDRGGVLEFKMHDLIHDIACAISNPIKLQPDPSNLLEGEFCINYSKKSARKLRTLICVGQLFHSKEMAIHNEIENCDCLRVLIIGWWSIKNLPNSIGIEKGCKIEEIGPLKNLRGVLKLSRLEQVISKEEATTANLLKKENLCELLFRWSPRFETQYGDCNDLEVLEGLQPHKNLQNLGIKNFLGEVLPQCIFVENLVVIYLYDCKRCAMLPMLGQLPNLVELEIYGLSSITSIGNEFYGNDSHQKPFFPFLKKFMLHNMTNLERWKEVGVASNRTIFPRLETLVISDCPKLTSIPNELQLYNSIEVLKIIRCPNLTLNLQNMPSLSILITHGLQQLPKGLVYLTSLKELEISGCIQDYDFRPLMFLSSLTRLHLSDDLITSVPQVPHQLEYLTNLQFLSIWNFNGIKSLPEWFGNLTSLEVLDLHMCGNLEHLPSTDAMLHLTKLKQLNVSQCPKLLLRRGYPERMKVSRLTTISVSN